MKTGVLLEKYIKNNYADQNGNVVIFSSDYKVSGGLRIIPYKEALEIIVSDLSLKDFDEDERTFNSSDVIWDWNIDTGKGIYPPPLTEMKFDYDDEHLKIKNIEAFVKFLYSKLELGCLPLSRDMLDFYVNEIVESVQYDGKMLYKLPVSRTRTHKAEEICFDCRTVALSNGVEVGKDLADKAEEFATVICFLQ